MRLKKLTLKNFGRHRNRTIEFHPGLNAITGPNGSGKSTTFFATHWLLTGDNLAPGVKAENVCDKAPEEEMSFGELEFEHNGNDYTVRRYLRPESKKATLESPALTKKVLGDKAVTEQLLAILEVDAKVLRTYSIVQQGELFAFLSADPGDRAKLFQRLFGTERCAEIFKQLGLHKSTIKLPSLVDTDKLLADQVAASQLHNQLKQQLDAMEPQASLLQRRDVYQNQIRQEHERQRLQQQLQARKSEHQPLVNNLNTANDQLRIANDANLVATGEANATSTVAATAKLALQQWQQYNMATNRQAQQQAQLTEWQTWLSQLERPTQQLPPDAQLQLTALNQKIGELHYRTQEIRTRQATLGVYGKAVCPTCKQSTTDICKSDEQILTTTEQELSQQRQQLQVLTTTLNQWAAYEKQYSDLTQRIEQLASTIAATVLPVRPAESQLSYQASLTTADNAETVRLKTLSDLKAKQSQCDALGTQLTRLNENIAATESALAALLPYMVPVEQLTAAVQETEQKMTERSNAEGALAQAVATCNWLQKQLDEALAGRVEYDRCQRWLTVVSKLEEMYHYNGLPKVVAQAGLLQLEQSVNAFLGVLDADFTVKPTPDLLFDATFRDGLKLPARRLSFGQLVTLGLSFMLSVNFQFLGHLGILLVDEPTAWLDSQRVEALLPMLIRLRDAAAARSLQVVIVTHEESLRPAFNNVIALPAITEA